MINDTFTLGKRLGKGSFGEVYMGRNRFTKKPVAIKLEHIKSKTRILEHEYKVYREIFNPNDTSGVVKCHFFGIKDDYSILVMDLLGNSLGDLFDQCGGKFSLKTTLMIADQMLRRLEFMHDKHYIHRDLKPDNMVIGRSHQQNQVYLIDYGLAKKYRSSGGQHIPFKDGGKLVGTARYASVNSHLGYQLSRRDDLISLGYILIYFLKGKLPWQKVMGSTKEEKYNNIRKLKQNLGSRSICVNLPDEFAKYLDYCSNLEFAQRPDYNYLKKLFKDLFKKRKLTYDLNFDWNQN